MNRNLIVSEEYRQSCVVYIHNNPVGHGFCMAPEGWQYSSYKTIISKKASKINRDEVIGWFGNKWNFISYHRSNAADMFAEKYNLP